MRTFSATTASRYCLSVLAILLSAAPARSQEEAFFSLTNQGFVLPGEIPAVQISSRNLSRVDFRVYQIPDPRAFFRAQPNLRSPRPVMLEESLSETASIKETLNEVRDQATRGYRDLARALLSSDLRAHLAGSGSTGESQPDESASAGQKEPPVLDDYPLLREFTTTLEPEREDWWTSETVPLFESSPDLGTYLVEAIAAGKRAYTVAMVTNLRYVAKQGPSKQEELLVFVASGDSGDPVAEARVSVLSEDDRKKPIQEATTTEEGIARLPVVRGSQILMVSRESDFLIGGAYFYFDAEDWDSDAPSNHRGRVYIYTDRPVYRPGHQVHFKSLLRSLDSRGRYLPAPAEEITVTATDPMNRSIFEKELTANNLGSVAGDLMLSSEPALGTYTLKVDWEGRAYYGHFEVEEYKKPEFEVVVSTDRSEYIAGDRMEMTVNATYYFGDPVAGGSLEYEIYQADYWRPWWEDFQLDWYFAGESEYHTYNYELVKRGDGKLGKDGNFLIELPTEGRDHDAVVRILARVTDSTNRQISGAKIVPVTAGTFRIDINSERYATAAEQAIRFDLETTAVTGELVSRELELEVIRRWWEDGDSFEETVQTQPFGTGSTGKASFEFTPDQPGSYQLTARGRDERGNQLRTTYHFWAWSSRPWWAEAREGGLELTPDKKIYSAGETAQLLLMSPIENPTVLFTVEGPTLFEHRIIEVTGTTASISLPLEEIFSPSVYVDATVISGGRFFQKNEILVIPPKDRFLNISIETDRPHYEPGENAEVTLAIRDEEGQPVDAEVSVGIVDQAIYAIAPDRTPDIRTFFFGKRLNEVRTSLSTGYYMYSSSQTARAGESPALDWADFKTVAETKVRKNFKDTMFWQAVVRTGSSGTVSIPVETPDNLTSWRITVRATDRNMRVGQETATFITRKDLMVRLGLPRFFRARDEGTLTATVHNSQEQAAEIRVEMQAEGIELDFPLEQTISLEEKSSRTLTWDYRAREPGAARFTVYALSEGKSDAEERSIPILSHGLQITEASHAFVAERDATARIEMVPPSDEVAEDLDVELSVSASLAGPVLESLDYLVGYPYGCVEQTMSRFLPTVLVARALRDLGVEAPPFTGKLQEIPQMVERGLSRIYNFQNYDGGWGWWEYDETRPFMTGYVLYGLARAKESGFHVDEGVLNRGMVAALDQVARDDIDTLTRIYLLYSLSVAGSGDRTMAQKLWEVRGEIDDLLAIDLAHLVLILARHGFEDESRQALDELLTTAQRSEDYIYWQSTNGERWRWRNDTLLTTAAALRAILAVDPEREEAVEAVRYLMSRRQANDRWRSTLDTSQIVFSLVEFLRARHELFADFDVEIRAGEQVLAKHHFGRADLFTEPWHLTVPVDAVANTHGVEIVKSGRGNLYGTLRWTYFTREEDIEPRRAGPLSIRRRYDKLTLVQKSDGSYEYRRTPLQSGATIAPGDLLLVSLTPRAAEDSEYLMVEDGLPSGFEVIEDIRGWRIQGIPYQEYYHYGWGWWYSHREVRDDRVVFFSSYFSNEQNEDMYYVLRAQSPGDYHIMPASMEMMYYPESRSSSSEMRLRVEQP